MDTKSYKIGLTTYTQGKLTIGQMKKIGKIYYLALSRAGEIENFTFEQIQGLIERFNLIGYFFAIILKPKRSFLNIIRGAANWLHARPYNYINTDNAPYDVIGAVFSDFFFLNESLIGKFVNLESGLGLIVRQAMEANTTRTAESAGNTSHSTPSQKNATLSADSA